VRGTPWPGVSSGLRPAGGSCGNAKCKITSVLAIIRLLPAIQALPQLEWNRISQVREYVDVWTLDPRRGWWVGHLYQRIRGWLFLLFLTELHVLSMLASTNPPTRDFSWALSSDITTSEVAASIRRRVETPSPSHLKALDHYFSSFSFQCKLQYFLETKFQIFCSHLDSEGANEQYDWKNISMLFSLATLKVPRSKKFPVKHLDSRIECSLLFTTYTSSCVLYFFFEL